MSLGSEGYWPFPTKISRETSYSWEVLDESTPTFNRKSMNYRSLNLVRSWHSPRALWILKSWHMEARSERKEHRLTLLSSSFDLAALLVPFDTLLKLVTTFRDYNPVISENTLCHFSWYSLLMILVLVK